MKQSLLFILIITANTAFAQNDIHFKNFSTASYHIQYPSNWTLDTSKLKGTEFIIVAPKENDDDHFSENINLLVQNLTGSNIDLEKYIEMSKEEIKKMAGQYANFKSKKMVGTGHSTYYSFSYELSRNAFKLFLKQYCYVKNNKAYLLTFTAETNKIVSYTKVAEKMLNSFTLTNNQTNK